MSAKLVLPHLQSSFYTRSKQKIVVKLYLLNEVGFIFKDLPLLSFSKLFPQMQAGIVFHHVNLSFVCHGKMQSTFVQMRAYSLFLVKFWCTHEVSVYIGNGVPFSENHIFGTFLTFVCYLCLGTSHYQLLPFQKLFFLILKHDDLHLSIPRLLSPKNQHLPFLTLLPS